MSWVRFDDGVADHPKLIDAGNAAAGVWFRSVAHCNKHLTDGRISEAVARALAGADGPDVVAELVRVGLWERAAEGYLVHDYLHFQPAAADVLAKRAAVAAKRSIAGRKGNASRWGASQTSQTDRKPIANGIAKPSQAPPKRPPRRAPDAQVPLIPSGTPAEPLVKTSASQTSQTASQNDRPIPTYSKSSLGRSAETGTNSSLEPSSPAGDRLPLKAGEPLRVLAATSGGRFPVVEARDVSRGQALGLISAIKRYPLRAEWERLGRWLAAGGLAYRTDLGVSWAASAALGDAMAAARAAETPALRLATPPPLTPSQRLAAREATAVRGPEAAAAFRDAIRRLDGG